MPGPCRVGCQRGCRVAGGGADHSLSTITHGGRDRARHAAILEAAGRIRALDLQPRLGAHPLGQPRRVDERRRALVERDDRVAGVERQPVHVALDQTWHRQNSSSITRIERGGGAHSVEPGDLVGRGKEARLEHRVGDHYEPCLIAHSLLHDRLDRHPVRGQHLGDQRQHARFVGDLQMQIERRDDVRDDRQLHHLLRRACRRDHRADNVPEHRVAVCGPPAPGAGHRDLGDRRRLDSHSVERPVHRGKRVARIQERGVHADRKPTADALGGADQLEPEAQLARVFHVVGGDLANPLVADLVQVHWTRRTRAARGSPSSRRRRGRRRHPSGRPPRNRDAEPRRAPARR